MAGQVEAGREMIEARFTLDLLQEALTALKNTRSQLIQPTPSGYYVMTIPSATRRILIMYEAKARWKARYRAERIARRIIAEQLHGAVMLRPWPPGYFPQISVRKPVA